MSILDFLGKEILYFDGAMGTRLQAAGLKPGELPEVWNITHGDVGCGTSLTVMWWQRFMPVT